MSEDAEAQALWDKFTAGNVSDAPAEKSEAEASDAAVNSEPVAETTTESVPQEDVAQNAPSIANPDDVWSSVPETARAAYQAAVQQKQALEHALRSAHGRAVRFQQEAESLRSKTKAAETVKPAAQTESRQNQGEVDPDLDVLRKDYPDIARPVERVFKSLREENEALRTRLQKLDEKAAEEELARQGQALIERHPDYIEVTDDPRFASWASKQPPYVIEALQRNGARIVNADEAADIISRYKAFVGVGQQPQQPPRQVAQSQPPALSAKRQQQLASAAAPQTRSAPKVSSGIPDDPEAAWNYFTAMTEKRRSAQTR